MIFNIFIFSIFSISVLWKIYYYLAYLWPFLRSVPIKNEKANPEGVSVIICARNELENLKNNLGRWLDQAYPEYEVIVVDDGSDDGSNYWLKAEAQKHDHLRVVYLGENLKKYPGKKLALLLGIKKASYDCILVSDADCYPAGKEWLKYMASGFTDDKKIVIGYAPDQPNDGLLPGFFRFETLVTALQYLPLAYKNRPYMAVGRNMGYRKSFFMEKGGFTGMLSIPSGDDDLFVSKYATSENTALVVAPEAYVYSPPKDSWSAWWEQKRRHLTAGIYYPLKTRIFLGSLWAFGALFYITALYLLFSNFHIEVVGGITGLILLLQSIFYFMAFQKLGNIKGWYFHLFYDMFYHCIYYPLAGMNTLLKSNQKINWK